MPNAAKPYTKCLVCSPTDQIVLILQSWVGGISSYATLVVLVPCHENVAIHTPVSAPAVEGNTIINATFTF